MHHKVIVRNERACCSNLWMRCSTIIVTSAVLRFVKPSAEIADGHDQGAKQRDDSAKTCWANVSFSARSVIVVGPELHLHPVQLAQRDFGTLPAIRSSSQGVGTHRTRLKSCKADVERKDENVWDILDRGVITNHPVLFESQPTLHHMGIQAFEPVLVEGNAIPHSAGFTRGFNADFDGDQMAVHLPSRSKLRWKPRR